MKLYGTLLETTNDYFTLLTVAENEQQAIENFNKELLEAEIINNTNNNKWDIEEINEVDGYKIILEKNED